MAILALAEGALAQDLDAPGALNSEVTIKLTNGDSITGVLVNNQGIEVVIDHDLLGRITIPRVAIAPPEPAEEEVDEVEAVSPWTGTFDFRLSGSSGNTTEHNYGGQLNLRHETEAAIDSVLATYNKESAKRNPGKNVTEDEFKARYRREWNIKDSKWLPFFQFGVTIDEFKDYDYRLETAGGLGYQWIKEENERFIGRVGAGGSKDVGGDDDDIVYEALLGFDYAFDFSKTNHVQLEVTVFPSVSGGIADDYRTFSRGEWRLDFSENDPWYFNVGFAHEYDNSPDPGNDRNDFDYFAGVGTRF